MIVLYPDPVLKKKCQKVEKVDQELSDVVSLLQKDLKEAEKGVGLAAPQVGKNKRIFIINWHDHKQVYINPEIVDSFGKEKTYLKTVNSEDEKEDFLEGCLSFPDVYGAVKRWLKIKVKYFVVKDNKLVKKREHLQDFLSIVFQHELDHLDGVLFIDHIKRDNGKLLKRIDGEMKEIDFKDL